MDRSIRAALTVLAFAAVAPTGAAAQRDEGPPPSQRGTVSQTVNTTVITVVYDRPSARGRVLLGDDGIVKYDSLWTPGANRATTFEFSRDVTFAGQPLAAGRYSVWVVPSAGEWKWTLNRTWDTHHRVHPGEDDDVLTVSLAPETGAHMETLAFYFAVVGPYETTLRLHWGETVVAIPIEVER